MSPSDTPPLLSVENISVGFQTDSGLLRAVDGVSFHINPGETLGLVGESGCGKSVSALSIMRLLPQPAGRILGGSIQFLGQDLATATGEQMQKIRGAKIGMIFQEPMTALNPVHTVGKQIAEVFQIHTRCSQKSAWQQAVDMLDLVGIPSPAIRASEYPHQLSGGMRQRVGIAMALALRPKLLIADEPTTALDVTIQAQILSLIRTLQHEMSMAVLLITHDLGVIAETCDRVAVMYAGKIAESATTPSLFDNPRHPYTQGLLQSIPRLDQPRKTRLRTIEGLVPSLAEMPSGCRFQNRCPHAEPRCGAASPPLENVASAHSAACFRWREIPPLG